MEALNDRFVRNTLHAEAEIASQMQELRKPRYLTDLAAVSPEEPARILEKVFFTPKDFEECVLYSFRD